MNIVSRSLRGRRRAIGIRQRKPFYRQTDGATLIRINIRIILGGKETS